MQGEAEEPGQVADQRAPLQQSHPGAEMTRRRSRVSESDLHQDDRRDDRDTGSQGPAAQRLPVQGSAEATPERGARRADRAI